MTLLICQCCGSSFDPYPLSHGTAAQDDHWPKTDDDVDDVNADEEPCEVEEEVIGWP